MVEEKLTPEEKEILALWVTNRERAIRKIENLSPRRDELMILSALQQGITDFHCTIKSGEEFKGADILLFEAAKTGDQSLIQKARDVVDKSLEKVFAATMVGKKTGLLVAWCVVDTAPSLRLRSIRAAGSSFQPSRE